MARNRLDVAEKVDITSDKLRIPKDFDVIVLADVLEHLVDPLLVLIRLRDHLKTGGEIIVSLPNVSCYNMRLGLLLGQFNYRDYGVLDSTHLRFFTKRTAKCLVRDAGFQIVKIDVTPYIIRPLFRLGRLLFFGRSTEGVLEERVLMSRGFQIYKSWIFPIEWLITNIWPTFLAYQFIVIARKN